MKSINEHDFCLIFNNVDGCIKESNGNENFLLASANKNKKVFKKYTELGDEIKNQIEAINGDNPVKHKKDFMKIRFESNDDLPLGEIISIPSMINFVTSVFQKDNKYYPQVYLQECGYEFVGRP